VNNKPTSVAILGATGAVGQKLIRLIEAHDHFVISELVASERNSGKSYAEGCTWRESTPLPKHIASMLLKSPHELTTPLILSVLPAAIALEIEPKLAKAGHWVISNASAFRMHHEVPLVIPEVNSDHLTLLDRQTTTGCIVTNPNCLAIFAALALKPLSLLGAIEHVSIVTLQAISGAGYSGLSACDIMGNTIPNIPGEEQKIESELLKIFGTTTEPAPFPITVHTNRVPVLHGHSAVLHVRFSRDISEEEVRHVFAEANIKFPDLYHMHLEPFSPQPQLHLHDTDNSAHIGRIKIGDHGRMVGLTVMGHNLVRGAAGAALLNLEAILDYRKATV